MNAIISQKVVIEIKQQTLPNNKNILIQQFQAHPPINPKTTTSNQIPTNILILFYQYSTNNKNRQFTVVILSYMFQPLSVVICMMLSLSEIAIMHNPNNNINQYIMFDEQFYHHQENSLDLLIKFNNQTENSHELSHNYYELTEKNQFPTGPHFDYLIEQFQRELENKDQSNVELLQKIRNAANQQENKMIQLRRRRKNSNKSLAQSKRVMGEETEISASPSKRRKIIKKGML